VPDEVRDRLIAADLVTNEEVEQHLHNTTAGLLDLAHDLGPGRKRA
jgi:hypothetical protein